MDFLKPAKYFFVISTLATIASIAIFIVPGPRLSIEFTGGTSMEILPENAALSSADLSKALHSFKDTELDAVINKLQHGTFLIRMKNIDDAAHTKLVKHMEQSIGVFKEIKYTTIGPTVGNTLKVRAVYAIIAASIGIILYLACAFRKIPRRYSPWKFGFVAVATLLHDVMVTVGVFVILSYRTSFEVDTLFVTALLTILGYSVNDTIIVFDRIRDNLFFEERKETFAVTANKSVNQTWKRSCYTSGSTLIMLLSLLFLGSSSVYWFVLTLIVGITLGTYSSIFVATPLLVYWNRKVSR